MKKEQLDKTKLLVEMILLRDHEYDRQTSVIKHVLQEHLFPILAEFLNTQSEKTEWYTVDLREGILLISALVTHDVDTVPDFLQELAPMEDNEDIVSVQRLIKIVIPVTLCFAPKEIIFAYLTERLKNQQKTQTSIPTIYLKPSQEETTNTDTTDNINNITTQLANLIEEKPSETNSVKIFTPTFTGEQLTPEQLRMLALFETTQTKTKQ
jgi:hypothetical protein